MPFTAKELEEMRLADLEIDKEFEMSLDDWKQSTEIERSAKVDAAYYRAHKDERLKQDGRRLVGL